MIEPPHGYADYIPGTRMPPLLSFSGFFAVEEARSQKTADGVSQNIWCEAKWQVMIEDTII
jgi:hypothetical protein